METVRVKTYKKEGFTKMKKRNWMYRLSSKSMSVMAALALMVTTMATNRSCMWYLGQDKMPEDSKNSEGFKS